MFEKMCVYMSKNFLKYFFDIKWKKKNQKTFFPEVLSLTFLRIQDIRVYEIL